MSNTVTNTRAARMIAAARAHGYEAVESDVAEDCWIIRRPGHVPGDDYLALYGSPRSGLTVMHFGSTRSGWDPITQRQAYILITLKGL